MVSLAGCLPIPVGSARILPAGEMSLGAGGLGRTGQLAPGIRQPGEGAGLLELRGGLAGGRLEAGWAIAVPWHMAWDLKLGLLREDGWIPAVAARADLGLFQPSFGGSVLVTKSAGRFALTLLGETGRRNERLWVSGSGPNAATSENRIMLVRGGGGELTATVSPACDLYADVTYWTTDTEHEAPKTGAAFKVTGGPSWFFGAGLRRHWTMSRAKVTAGPMTALRGYILSEADPERVEVGQPGIYKAVVLLDAGTRILFDGKPVERSEMTVGRAVLIQGIALPKASTFLARTIELQ